MERRAIAVDGVVQGVGFRPFVYGLASRLRLGGFVKNRVGGVLIEVEGEVRALDRFLAELANKPPPLARIDHLAWEVQAPRGDGSFHIEPSEVESPGPIFVSPDAGWWVRKANKVWPGRSAIPGGTRHGRPALPPSPAYAAGCAPLSL